MTTTTTVLAKTSTAVTQNSTATPAASTLPASHTTRTALLAAASTVSPLTLSASTSYMTLSAVSAENTVAATTASSASITSPAINSVSTDSTLSQASTGQASAAAYSFSASTTSSILGVLSTVTAMTPAVTQGVSVLSQSASDTAAVVAKTSGSAAATYAATEASIFATSSVATASPRGSLLSVQSTSAPITLLNKETTALPTVQLTSVTRTPTASMTGAITVPTAKSISSSATTRLLATTNLSTAYSSLAQPVSSVTTSIAAETAVSMTVMTTLKLAAAASPGQTPATDSTAFAATPSVTATVNPFNILSTAAVSAITSISSSLSPVMPSPTRTVIPTATLAIASTLESMQSIGTSMAILILRTTSVVASATATKSTKPEVTMTTAESIVSPPSAAPSLGSIGMKSASTLDSETQFANTNNTPTSTARSATIAPASAEATQATSSTQRASTLASSLNSRTALTSERFPAFAPTNSLSSTNFGATTSDVRFAIWSITRAATATRISAETQSPGSSTDSQIPKLSKTKSAAAIASGSSRKTTSTLESEGDTIESVRTLIAASTATSTVISSMGKGSIWPTATTSAKTISFTSARWSEAPVHVVTATLQKISASAAHPKPAEPAGSTLDASKQTMVSAAANFVSSAATVAAPTASVLAHKTLSSPFVTQNNAAKGDAVEMPAEDVAASATASMQAHELQLDTVFTKETLNASRRPIADFPGSAVTANAIEGNQNRQTVGPNLVSFSTRAASDDKPLNLASNMLSTIRPLASRSTIPADKATGGSNATVKASQPPVTQGSSLRSAETLLAQEMSKALELYQDASAQQRKSLSEDLLSYASSALSAWDVARLGHTLEELVQHCTFDGVPCDLDKDFELVPDPSLGNCFAFNNRVPIKYRITSTGSNYGLKLQFGVNQSEYLWRTEKAGAAVMIGSQREAIFADTSAHHLDVGRLNVLELLNIREQTRLGSPYGTCAESTDAALFYYNGSSYSKEGCLMSCLQKMIVRACDCAYSMIAAPPDSDHVKFCGPNKFECMDHVREFTRPVDYETNCSCPSACVERYYKVAFTRRSWPTRASPPATLGCTANRIVDCPQFTKINTGSLHVFVDDLSRTVIAEEAAYTLLQLLSDIGANTGVFLGMSILSFFEIFTVSGGVLQIWWSGKPKPDKT